MIYMVKFNAKKEACANVKCDSDMPSITNYVFLCNRYMKMFLNDITYIFVNDNK